MGLLVVQVLDAMLDPAQKYIGLRQGLGCGSGHQLRTGHPLERLQGGLRA